MERGLSLKRAILWLVMVGVAVRAGLFLVYQPAIYPDTGTFQVMAAQILHLDFSSYAGVRTPGYPLLLAMGGEAPTRIWLLQSALGVLISLLIFWICFLHTRNTTWALVAGLAHTLALNQLFFEANIVAETLTTFLIVAGVASLAMALRSSPAGYGALSGLLASMAALTRPLYVYLGPLFALLVLCFERDRRRLSGVLFLAFIVPVLAWSVFNKVTLGHFTLSTNLGYGLTNHSGRFMEKAPDQYATLRDIYLKHRETKIAETGSSAATIFIARDEMREKTGLDEVALSQELARLSFDLFARYPGLYLASVGEAWASFWAAPLYFRPENFRIPAVAKVVEWGFFVERKMLLVANLLAIIASAWVITTAVGRRLKGRVGLSIPLILSTVLIGASVLQALLEYSENPRYGIPTQSFSVTLVLLVAWDFAKTVRSRQRAVVTAGGAIARTAETH